MKSAFFKQTTLRYAITFFLIGLMVIIARLYAYSIPAADQLAKQVAIESTAAQIYQNSAESTVAGIDPKVSTAVEEQTHLWEDEADRLTEVFKKQRSFETAEGKRHPFVAGYDSYYWLRLARDYSEKGSLCADQNAAECRNAISLAPVGHAQDLTGLPHVQTIAGFHRILQVFDADIPLDVSANYLSLFLAVLVIFPAFFIGQRLSGFYAGVAAAITVSFGSIFISRTLGIDTDIWNVLLLLCILATTILSFDSRRLFGRVIWIVVAAVITGLWATIWSGWMLGYVIVMAALVLHFLLCLVARSDKSTITQSLIIIAVYYVVCGVYVFMSPVPVAYFDLPLSVFHSLFSEELATTSLVNWPDNFATVAEWARVGVGGVLTMHGGIFFFLLACLGGLWVIFDDKLRYWDQNVLGLGALFYGILFSYIPESKVIFYVLVCTPISLIFLYRIITRCKEKVVELSVVGLILISFMACLWLSVDALRLLLFSWVPFAILLSVTISRLSQAIANHIPFLNQKMLVHSVAATLFIGMTLYAILPGLQMVHTHAPTMYRALQLSLEDVRKQAAPDAILSPLWDYGYFAQYYAERGTTMDGGTLRNRANYWLNRALTESDERKSIGILRMLNCGSDASALPEQRFSAMSRLMETGRNEKEAYLLLNDLVSLNKKQAHETLMKQGFSGEHVQNILASSHCEPPESLLLTTTEMISKTPAWFGSGVTDVLASEIKPIDNYAFQMEPRWLGCNSSSTDIPDLACEMSLLRNGESEHYLFVVDFSKPESFSTFSRLTGQEYTLGLLLIADGERITMYENDQADISHVGILLNKVTHQILVGRPEVLKSEYARLQLLDGKYSKYVEKLTGHSDEHGESVSVWRVIRWE